MLGVSAIIMMLDWKIIIVFALLVVLGAKIEGSAKKKAMDRSQEIATYSAARNDKYIQEKEFSQVKSSNAYFNFL